MSDPPQISVVMPTWNGAGLLRESLPLLKSALAHDGATYELVLVDNGSEDDTREVFSAAEMPGRLVRLARNEGFSYACNVGIRQAAGPRVLLINNDILVPRGFLAPLREQCAGDVFAAGSAMVPRAEAFGEAPVPDAGPRDQLGVPTHCCLLDREEFLRLGGFDLVFSPAMWEEMDLGVRAWRAGRRVVVDPRSRVFHYCRATVRRAFRYVQYERLYHRNRLLFLWKNLPPDLLRRHLLTRLPLDCASDVLTRGGMVITVALAQALCRLGQAGAGRRATHKAGSSLIDAVRATGEEGDLMSWL